VAAKHDSIVAEVEVLISPYAGPNKTFLQLLLDELENNEWNLFRCAVAFASESGNFPDLLKRIVAFAKRGGRVEMTFGADVFGGEGGSEYAAIEELLKATKKLSTVRVSLYREKGRIFHPKLYLFANKKTKKARIVIGSSNWGGGGFHANVEANVVLDLNLVDPRHAKLFDYITELFELYWQEI
jgi:hypothetical protein